MGMMRDGEWLKVGVNSEQKDGEFARKPTTFRGRIGAAPFEAETGRYHLYVSYACPWAHRTLIARAIKGLEQAIDVSVVSPFMLEEGWSFEKDMDGATGDQIFGFKYLRELYKKTDERFTGRVTVPVLWDKKRETIVSNESEEIIRILDQDFGPLANSDTRLSPEELMSEILQWNEKIYEPVNNGVYKCGFSTSQEAYERNAKKLFDRLDEIDQHVRDRDYLALGQLTEADIRLFTTLVRFDQVYYVHFKCCYRRIQDYPGLSRYLKNLYLKPAFQKTTHFDHIRAHYYYSHKELNPNQIIPYGPKNELTEN